ncbi:MAG: hypothetical protein KBT27_01645, partial [Prevotellaceae bacterium]|nr:hypothetical protein [Candidatus Faecinaster equi]
NAAYRCSGECSQQGCRRTLPDISRGLGQEPPMQNHFISIIWRKRTDANGPQSGPQYLIDNKDIDNTDSQSGPQYGPQSGPQEKLAKRYRGLLETIVAKPTISKEDLAAQFKISLTTLKRDLKCLRQSYEITWIGWTQNGHWEVKELDKKKQ